MFKELGQIAGLMRQLPKIKEEMEGLQNKLGDLTAEGNAGGDMVKVKVNGRFEMLACVISDEAVADKEMLEDLIRSAHNQALERVRALTQEEAGKMANNLGLPPGMNLPGIKMPGE